MALLEGSLAPEAAQQVRERLLADPGLRAEYEYLQTMDARLVDLEEDDAAFSFDLTASVLERVRTQAADAPASDFVLEGEWLMAALDGELAGPDAVHFQERLCADADLRKEYESLGALHASLIQLGEIDQRGLPAIDLVGGVLSRVNPEPMEGRILPFPARDRSETRLNRRKRESLSLWGVGAAAACVFVAAGLVLGIILRANLDDSSDLLAQNNLVPSSPAPASEAAATPAEPAFAPTVDPIMKLNDMNDKLDVVAPADPESSTPHRGPVTLEDALNARRADMLGDSRSLSRLAALASLTEDQAKEVLASAGLSPEALLGAAQFLSDEDARMILSALVEKNPQDPYLRMALSLRGEPADMLNQATAWSELDPDNALPHYVQAQAHFAQGNAVDGLAALAAANGLQSGGMYTSDAAIQRAQAYAASGMDYGTAQVLAASTAGYFEGQTLSGLTDSLMAQGRNYEQAGNYQAAEDVYSAVRELGAQVDTGALFTQERAAALDTQTQAVLALQGLYELLQAPESQVILGELATQIIDGLGVLDAQMSNLNQAFNNNANNVVNLAGFILTNGNLGDLLGNLF